MFKPFWYSFLVYKLQRRCLSTTALEFLFKEIGVNLVVQGEAGITQESDLPTPNKANKEANTLSKTRK